MSLAYENTEVARDVARGSAQAPTAPRSHQVVARLNLGLLDYIIIAAPTIWLAGLTLPWLTVPNPHSELLGKDALADSLDAAAQLTWYWVVAFAAGVAGLTPCLLRLGNSKSLELVIDRKVILAMSLGIVGLFHALLFSEAPRISLGYTVSVLIAFVSFYAWWAQAERLVRLSAQLASLFLAAFFAGCLVKFGLPDDRYLGGLHPNLAGGFAETCVALAFLGGHKLVRSVCLVLMLTLCVVVDSRSGLVAILLFSLLYAFFAGERHTKALIVAIAALGAIAFLVVTTNDSVFSSIVLFTDPILHLSSHGRGISSGVSGRSDHWDAAIQYLVTGPILGVGFRTPLDTTLGFGAHSGILELLVDFGALGVLLLILLMLDGAGTGNSAARVKLWSIREADERAVTGAYMLAFIFGHIMEPAFLNLGFGSSLFFIAFIARPSRAQAMRWRGGQVPRAASSPMVPGRLHNPAARRKSANETGGVPGWTE